MSSAPQGATPERDILERVTVIIVTYQSVHCLDAQDPLLSVCPHVILIDNGSDDGTLDVASARWPHARIMALKKNYGFGAANNLALRHVNTPWVLLINPDCLITASALRGLIQTGECHPDAAVVVPQLLNSQNQPEINYRWPSTHWTSRGPGADGLCCVGFACGAAMLMRVSMMPNPVFDEQFFLYYEDDDLCLHFFRNKLSILVQPDCTAIHQSRGSVAGNRAWRNEYLRGYYHAQSKLTFSKKYLGIYPTIKLQAKLVFGNPLLAIFFLVTLNWRLAARTTGRWIGAMRWSRNIKGQHHEN
jgi:GT2 family glycosyltransferase